MHYLVHIAAMLFICGVSLAYVANPLFAALIFGATVITLTFLRSVELALLLCMFCIPFDRLMILNPDADFFTLNKALIFLAAVAWAVNWILRRDTTWIRSLIEQPATILIVCFIGVSFLCTFHARDPMTGLGLTTRRFLVFGLFWLVVSLVRSRKMLDYAINVLMFSSVFVCAVGFYEFFLQQQFLATDMQGDDLALTVEGASRIQGFAGNSNFHAAILVMLLPFASTRLLQARWHWKWMWLLLVAAYFFNILATNTRQGTYGAFIVMAGILLFNHIPFKLFLITGASAVGLGTILLMSLDDSVAVDRYTGESGMKTVEYRLGWMLMSLEMGKDNPLLGMGTGHYFSEYNRYRRVAATDVDNRPIKNHMGIMQVWAENGILGLSVYLAILVSLTMTLIPLLRKGAVPADVRMLAVGVLGGYVMYVWFIGIIPVMEHEIGWINMGFVVSLRTMYDRGLFTPQNTKSVNATTSPPSAGYGLSVV